MTPAEQPAATDLDGFRRRRNYADATVVAVAARRTHDSAYPSSWAYSFHYGVTRPDADVSEPSLDDGTIRRYDNAHEDTKGHELHAAPDVDPTIIEFLGIVSLYLRFWDEIEKDRTAFEGRSTGASEED